MAAALQLFCLSRQAINKSLMVEHRSIEGGIMSMGIAIAIVMVIATNNTYCMCE
eukprot:COSAG01_NODE_670_length_14354_cov_14.787653_8_plen_54_part_00